MCTDAISMAAESPAHTHHVASPNPRGITPPPPIEEWDESGKCSQEYVHRHIHCSVSGTIMYTNLNHELSHFRI